MLRLLFIHDFGMGTVRYRFGGMVRFKGGLRCKGRINSAIIEY